MRKSSVTPGECRQTTWPHFLPPRCLMFTIVPLVINIWWHFSNVLHIAKLASSKEQKWAPENKAGELLSEIRGSLTRSHPQWRSDVFVLRRSQLIGLFCYSSRSAAWHTNVKWENSMCKARWDANRKEELPPDEIQRGGNAYRIFWDWGQGWCLMPSQLCCC